MPHLRNEASQLRQDDTPKPAGAAAEINEQGVSHFVGVDSSRGTSAGMQADP